MLNTAYSKKNININDNDYVLPETLVSANIKSNTFFDTGEELRLQKVYGDELWKKINSLDRNINWSEKNVLDICCGTGFLSYHLLSRVQPKKLTLLDISDEEINSARCLLNNSYNNPNINYIVKDFLKLDGTKHSYDIIIGNSFLHHFYNLPLALNKINDLLKPGGIFISLHEPTIASRAFESRNPFYSLMYMIRGEKYLDDFRFNGIGIKPGYGADIWIFKNDDLVKLFNQAGLVIIKKNNWHFFRAIFASIFNLHLHKKNKKLNKIQGIILQLGIKIDSILNKFLNDSFFSSVSILAKKK